MVKRTRLSKKAGNGSKSRLRSAVHHEVELMSDSQLKDFASATKSVIAIDPIMSVYKKMALEEIDRRKALQKQWGKEEPRLPPAGALAVTETLEVPSNVFKKMLRFYDNVARGNLAEDVIFASDYMADRLTEFWHHGQKAKERWSEFAKAHGVLGKKENDYLNEGYELKKRFKFNVDQVLFKHSVSNYRKGYKSVVIVPSVVDGENYYSLFVKGVRK